ncbi:MAG TPA: methylamine dehydrogenase light chain [Phenylobacterium sp.]|jgi:methylamine dehydrogenase light chain
MASFDRLTEAAVRRLAQRTGRRSLLGALGGVVAGGFAMPLLPVARAAQPPKPLTKDPGDPTSCDYWRYCAIDGYLCSCCGGSVSSCPPGTEMSPITWIGTCLNPADNRRYVVSYNDCCGKPSCDRCLCNRNEGDRPMTRPQVNNDILWCLGTASQSYTCSTAIIIGDSAAHS